MSSRVLCAELIRTHRMFILVQLVGKSLVSRRYEGLLVCVALTASRLTHGGGQECEWRCRQQEAAKGRHCTRNPSFGRLLPNIEQ